MKNGLRGAIGDLQFLIDEIKVDDDVIIIAGDNLFTYSLAEYYDYYKAKDDDCVCVKQFDDPEMIKQLGVVLLDENNKIIDFEEKPQQPKSNMAAFATYIYKKSTVSLIKRYLDEGNKPDAPCNFLAWLYKEKNVFAYIMNGECYDIGTHKALEEVNAIFG